MPSDDVDFMVAFIDCIKKYPCIWDSTITAYARIDLTSQAWRAISAEMNDTEDSCRTRWKNIRTSLGRSLRPHRSGKLRKPYYLSKFLKFLLPHVKGGLTVENSPTNDGNDDPVEFKYEGFSAEVHDAVNSSVDETSSIEESLFEDAPKAKRPRVWSRTRAVARKNYAEEDTDEGVNFKIKKEECDKKEDSDWFFFRSLLTDFKKLDNRRKRTFKSEILSLLNEQLNEMEGV